MKSGFLNLFKMARQDLGVSFEAPHLIYLDNNVVLSAPVLVHNFGAPNGTLIFTFEQNAWEHRDRIKELGYAMSTMSVPCEDELWDRDSMIEMFSEWGWAGKTEDKPYWMTA